MPMFFKKNQGDKGAEFAEYFRRKTRNGQVLRNISQLHVIFIRKGVQESRLIFFCTYKELH